MILMVNRAANSQAQHFLQAYDRVVMSLIIQNDLDSGSSPFGLMTYWCILRYSCPDTEPKYHQPMATQLWSRLLCD